MNKRKRKKRQKAVRSELADNLDLLYEFVSIIADDLEMDFEKNIRQPELLEHREIYISGIRSVVKSVKLISDLAKGRGSE